MKYLTFLSYCTDYCGCALTYVSNYCTPAIKLPCLSLHEMSLGRQRSALSVFQIFLIGCLSSFQSCPFPLNLCGLICIEVTHLKDAAPLGCVVVIIYHPRFSGGLRRWYIITTTHPRGAASFKWVTSMHIRPHKLRGNGQDWNEERHPIRKIWNTDKADLCRPRDISCKLKQGSLIAGVQ
jgi:hypothetical protein